MSYREKPEFAGWSWISSNKLISMIDLLLNKFDAKPVSLLLLSLPGNVTTQLTDVASGSKINQEKKLIVTISPNLQLMLGFVSLASALMALLAVPDTWIKLIVLVCLVLGGDLAVRKTQRAAKAPCTPDYPK